MISIDPTTCPRRPFHWRELQAAGALFAARDGAAVAWRYGFGPEAEATTARVLGLADLSPLPRSGLKGRDALARLADRGLSIGKDANRAYRQPDGTLVVKLAPTEVLLLPDPVAPPGADPSIAAREEEGSCLQVPRRDGSLWFRLTGIRAAAVLAKLCGVDLRPPLFADHAVAQTIVARLSGIVVRDDLATADGPLLAYHLLADSASARYLWRALAGAMAEFGGTPIGLAALLALSSPGRRG